MQATRGVVLASMPWTTLRAPSIQIGTVKAVLDAAGIPAATEHLYVPFFNFVSSRLGLAIDEVDEFEQCGWLFGEWIFAVPPFRAQSETSDERFRLRFTREFGEGMVNRAFSIRRMVPEFLEASADRLLEQAPAVVGFSSTFAQTVPSLVLGKLLKQRDPDLAIVLGGSNCEGPMGEAIARRYPWVDVVVRGEAEDVVPQLFQELLEGGPVTAQPGLCVRSGEALAVTAEDRPRVQLARVPLPAYEEYFTKVDDSPLKDTRLWLPYETSRGCWWGVKHLCTFCAANGATLTFRSRPAEVVLDQLAQLPERYGLTDVWFVDNILDERYLGTVFPELRRRHSDLSIFVETKAHLSRRDLETLHEAGVVMAQVGVESLSTPILTLMDKGTTVVQNVRILKWCAEIGIKTFWNIIYGFPGESPEEYQRMADLVPSLTHLQPPNQPVPLRLDRFSPYHADPDRYGIEVTGPLPINRFVHPGSTPDVLDLQYFFSFRYRDQRRPEEYVGPLRDAVGRWRQVGETDFGRLSYRVEAGTVTICEQRRDRPRAEQVLDEAQSHYYLACEAGASAQRVWRDLPAHDATQTTPEEIRIALDEMVAKRWMLEDRGTYLSLALTTSAEPRRRPPDLRLLDSLSDARRAASVTHA